MLPISSEEKRALAEALCRARRGKASAGSCQTCSSLACLEEVQAVLAFIGDLRGRRAPTARREGYDVPPSPNGDGVERVSNPAT